MCFGCKKVKTHLTDHLQGCEHHEEHFRTLKRLIGEELPAVPGGCADPEEVLALKKEVERLSKRLKESERDFEHLANQFYGEDGSEDISVETFCKEVFNADFTFLTEEQKKNIIVDAKAGKVWRYDPNEGDW
jgi:hypothetical protein